MICLRTPETIFYKIEQDWVEPIYNKQAAMWQEMWKNAQSPCICHRCHGWLEPGWFWFYSTWVISGTSPFVGVYFCPTSHLHSTSMYCTNELVGGSWGHLLDGPNLTFSCLYTKKSHIFPTRAFPWPEQLWFSSRELISSVAWSYCEPRIGNLKFVLSFCRKWDCKISDWVTEMIFISRAGKWHIKTAGHIFRLIWPR